MEADFWHEKWKTEDIGFHEGRPNALLVKHLERLSLGEGARIFLPLCGKTRDIHWLMQRGFRVAGAELSRIAVEQLFEELELSPTLTPVASLTRYSAPGIDIFQGDILELTGEGLGPIDAVYDRAALVALPTTLRERYAAHMIEAAAGAPYLLICFHYDQNLIEGPPFAIDEAEVRRLYAGRYELLNLEKVDVEGGLKGKYAATEEVWLLSPR